MGVDNRAWITDYEYDDDMEWAFTPSYLGGSVETVVDLSTV